MPDFVLGPSSLQGPDETASELSLPSTCRYRICPVHLSGFGTESTVNSQLSMQMEWNIPLIIQKEQRVHK